MNTGMYKFKPRLPELLAIEGDYGDFMLSCRHKDILRCSVTRHFTSCYRPEGVFREVPYRICCYPQAAIIGKKDKSGSWIWRAFVWIRLEHYMDINYKRVNSIEVFKIYGNYPEDIRMKIIQDLKPNWVIFREHDLQL